MCHKLDKVRFKEKYAREQKLPPYLLMVTSAYEGENGTVYNIVDTMNDEEYIAIPEEMLELVKAYVPKPDSEKISKNKKGGFKIRKSMFTGMWFIGCPIMILAFLLTKSYWVFAAALIPLAVGIFGADDETDENAY